MLGIVAAIFFGQQGRNATHDLVGGLFDGLVAIFLGQRRDGEGRSACDADARSAQAFEIAKDNAVLRSRRFAS